MNPFVQWLMSPLSQWHLTSLSHKLVVGAVGTAAGYYLFTKKYPTWQVALGTVGAAYAASLVINAATHYSPAPAVAAPTPQPIQAPPPVEEAQVEQEGTDAAIDDYEEEAMGDEGIFG